jgi:hypothetical protein
MANREQRPNKDKKKPKAEKPKMAAPQASPIASAVGKVKLKPKPAK